MKQIIVLIFTFATSYSLFAADLKIKSDPENAVVYIREASSNKRNKLGETPLKISLDDVFNNYTKDRTFVIEIEKNGHKNYNMLVSIFNKADINFDVKMEVSHSVELTKNFDMIFSQLFESQRLLRDKNYPSAIETLTTLSKKHGNLSTVYELLGSAYYLKKDFQNALSSYRKAFSLNADNSDAYSMKLYLEKALGVRSVK